MDHQEVILLVQRVLCLLGSASHSITLERRKVAWSMPQTHPLLLQEEKEKEKDITLFGGGFLEQVTKRQEDEKVTSQFTRSGNRILTT